MVSQAIKAALNDVYTRPANVGTDFWKIGPRRIEESRADPRNVNFTRTSSHGDANLASSVFRQNPAQIREKRPFRTQRRENKTGKTKVEFLELVRNEKKKNNTKERNFEPMNNRVLWKEKRKKVYFYLKKSSLAENNFQISSKSPSIYKSLARCLRTECAMNAFTRFDALAIRRRNALPSM